MFMLLEYNSGRLNEISFEQNFNMKFTYISMKYGYFIVHVHFEILKYSY